MMNVTIEAVHYSISEQLGRYIRAMTREVLRGLTPEPQHVIVRLRRDNHSGGECFHCDVRVYQTQGELVFDGSARHPHAAVERALEQLWHVLRSRQGHHAA
jgi:ribosome-associated translation inhibitor RaiA